MRASLPQAWGVLYAAPNEDGERKTCGNCEFLDDGDCEVLGIEVEDDQICGYHIESGTYADPKVSGFGTVKGGTSCDICRFYEATTADGGNCAAVVDEDGDPAKVEAMGCCARWEAK